MKEFVKTDKYGKLYMDKILFESYFPIIFTCKNDNDEIFIGVCCQNNEKGRKWLIGRTNGGSIVNMLRDEITIRELLLKYSSGKISVDFENGKYAVEYSNSDWDEDSIYLPKDDSYIYAEEGEFDDDIAYFLSIGHVCYKSDYYKKLPEISGTVNKEIGPMTGLLNVFIPPVLGQITIQSEVINTSNVLKNFCVSFSSGIESSKVQKKYEQEFNVSFEDLTNDLCMIVGMNGNNWADAA